MRTLPAALVAAHVVLIGYVYDQLARKRSVPPAPPPAAPAVPSVPSVPTRSLDSLSLRELEAVARVEDSLVLAVQEDSANVDAMAELAHLYMLHGSFDHAVGPLARALEVQPGRDDLWYELLLALKLSKLDEQHVDLAQLAREFAEMAAMAGHGC